jgi:sporulation protein YlmC with PRC-barrel domain
MAELGVMHDIMDGQLMTADGRRVGRVADLGCLRNKDGSVEVSRVVLGPEAGLRRIASRLAGIGRAVFAGRHERSVSIGEVAEFGPTVRLRGVTSDYDLHDGDGWAAGILRWIPGSAFDSRPGFGDRPRRMPAPDLWISDLIGTPVIDRRARPVGHVVELYIRPRHHRITALRTGPTGWLDRLGLRAVARRIRSPERQELIEWADVDHLGIDRIVLSTASQGADA